MWKRYVIVTNNNVGNKYSATIMIAPTTTKGDFEY